MRIHYHYTQWYTECNLKALMSLRDWLQHNALLRPTTPSTLRKAIHFKINNIYRILRRRVHKIIAQECSSEVPYRSLFYYWLLTWTVLCFWPQSLGCSVITTEGKLERKPRRISQEQRGKKEEEKLLTRFQILFENFANKLGMPKKLDWDSERRRNRKEYLGLTLM